MNSTKLLFLIALFVAIFSTRNMAAPTPPPARTNTVAPERFLVIVETSAPMQKRAENVQKALGSVISSGLSGAMASGSTIGLWTFTDKLTTGQLPLQLWTPVTRQRVALTMVQFLQQLKHEKNPRLATAWEAATNIIAQSERITVLLITSGNEPLVGTPFDAAITESFIKNADVQRKQNMPFLTILRAVRGEIVAYAVNMPPWPLEVPEYPDGFKPAPPTPPPVIETNPAPVVVKRPDPAILSPTNTIFFTETSPPVEVPQPPPPEPEPPKPVGATAQNPPPPATMPAPVPAPGTPGLTAQPVVAAARTETAAAAPPPAAAKSNFPIVTILIAGIAVLLAVLLVFLALLRWARRATGASLITRSMDKGPK